MQLTFLGTSGSLPTIERSLPCVALRINSEVILFDCGEGTQRQLMNSRLSFMKINKILITHFHADHFLGIAGLIQSMNFNDRKKPLEIFVPKGGKHFVKKLLSSGYFNPTFEIIVREVKDKETVKCNGYDIKVRRAEHLVPNIAYCIEEHRRKGKFNVQKAKELGIPEGRLYGELQKGKTIFLNGRKITPRMVLGEGRRGRKIVYSGDTVPCKAIIELSKNADVLIHEAIGDSSLQKKANKYGHSTAKQSAEVAKEANVKQLILIHLSPRYKEIEILEKEAKEIFENTIVAKDFMELEVKRED